MRYDCSDLIGLPYKLGSDGSNGTIDCIHMVYAALRRMGIKTPQFNPTWYNASARVIYRDLKAWGRQINSPQYDGDVLLILEAGRPIFAVAWETGIIYINQQTEKVAWSTEQAFTRYRCFRTKEI